MLQTGCCLWPDAAVTRRWHSTALCCSRKEVCKSVCVCVCAHCVCEGESWRSFRSKAAVKPLHSSEMCVGAAQRPAALSRVDLVAEGKEQEVL